MHAANRPTALHLRPLLAASRVALLAVIALVPVARAEDAAPASPAAAQIERGRYFVTIGSCNDCHTPWALGPEGPAPDMTRMLSGHPAEVQVPPAPPAGGPWVTSAFATNTAWAGPWGVSFTANLTSDVETGIGAWTEDEFIGALRSGRHRGRGREILPPMPWPMIGQATDDDLRAVLAYLKSTPPIRNRVPDPLPPAAAE